MIKGQTLSEQMNCKMKVENAMIDSIKIGNFIARKRKEAGLTQQQLADKLNISFRAVPKWETGNS